MRGSQPLKVAVWDESHSVPGARCLVGVGKHWVGVSAMELDPLMFTRPWLGLELHLLGCTECFTLLQSSAFLPHPFACRSSWGQLSADSFCALSTSSLLLSDGSAQFCCLAFPGYQCRNQASSGFLVSSHPPCSLASQWHLLMEIHASPLAQHDFCQSRDYIASFQCSDT